uniref:Predicted ATPase n=1 Tax=Candidatus Kentrum sp. FW TaxID=2126338 RepID=A0A450TPS0_9GAMM|nr:MAG: Predicted ATPase [Candidatus Kentron sp. FW]
MPKLQSLSISGFKSIRELKSPSRLLSISTIGPRPSGFPLSDLNVLIGANGAGKSNFISLFRLLNEMAGQRLQLFVQQQGGPDALLHFGRKRTERLRGAFHFDRGSYEFDLVPAQDNRLVFVHECYGNKDSAPDTEWDPIPSGSGYPESLLWAPFPLKGDHAEPQFREAKGSFSSDLGKSSGNWRFWHFCDTGETARIKQRHPGNDNLILKPDAANLGAYLRRLHREHGAEYGRIVSTIRLVAPFFGDFVHRPGEPEYIELEWTSKDDPDTPFKAHVLSDGTLRFMCLATLLLQPIELLPATILIDEPELGLHPYAIAVLADIFRQVAEERQLIVSTQSVELVNELEPEDVIVVDQEDGASTFRRLEREELSGWLEEYALGELWRRNIIGGSP